MIKFTTIKKSQLQHNNTQGSIPAAAAYMEQKTIQHKNEK
jgi:hypothetical protein